MCFDVGWAALEQDRRQLERDIFSGKLSGIAATNAPELGIDVGHIDAALHLGFPGSVASSWQQAGRSGRRERPSLAVYVSFEEPLDQYFMKFPKTLPWSVLKQHLVCAALEHPLSLLHDEKYFGSSLGNALMSLKNKGDLSFDPSRDSSARIWSYIGHEAVWIPVPQSIKELVEEKQFSIRGGLRAASHALLNCPNPHDSRYFPGRILVYDQHPGGTGVSMQTQPYFPGLLNAALELLTCCHCSGDTGCPNCVQSMVCHEYNEVIIHKDAAIMIIEDVLDAESFFGEANDSS
uniref:Helicase C-terminal domain-containing protein n=1 Tax=Populus alba TaxID=43335 RepID=A0A4U5QT40_POPAL|nr:hypothetical protein D5086_0000061660 [Populus alba]